MSNEAMFAYKVIHFVACFRPKADVLNRLKYNPCNPHQLLHFRVAVFQRTSSIFVAAEAAGSVTSSTVVHASSVEILASGTGDLVDDGAEVNLAIDVGGHFYCLRRRRDVANCGG